MGYRSLEHCIIDLEKHGHLVRIREEVDPHLEMAAIHLRVYANNGPALLFERVKGSEYRAASNLFGTIERSRFLFRDTLDRVSKLVRLKGDPALLMKHPSWLFPAAFGGLTALPRKSSARFDDIRISDLPQIRHWPMDGGPFVTLPQVYTEDADRPGVLGSNLGMYRIQLGGNSYVQDREIGLHYQLHRGIGVHQTKSNALGLPLKVAVFVGGPPSHTFAAVMPLPEGIPEVSFAGALGGRRFRYHTWEGHTISSDADFVILGEVFPKENRPEGPFGDHLGYYSLTHDFPLMRVKRVLAKRNGIWPFTVVGRPPQEDTSFGALIHEITGPIVPQTIPGLKEVHAVDAAGVHPLLFAIGSERYTPYSDVRRPQEILTIANAILGFNQMSLAKFLIIAARQDNEQLTTHDEGAFLRHVLERIDPQRDLHFYTNTTIDTLDYSGDGLNTGSKVVIAAAGEPLRSLSAGSPLELGLPDGFADPHVVMPGILSVQGSAYTDGSDIRKLADALIPQQETLNGFPLIVVADDSGFIALTLNNFLWATFTRCNPSHDIDGVGAFVRHKHWGCTGPLIFDARVKPQHAPPLIVDTEVEKRVDALGSKGASLHGII
ncbi:MAG: UbiD family decarboxylase [Flavobacteriales bacterium]|nr:UbiD family decarboxylase [Flavobacteriales bacterium]